MILYNETAIHWYSFSNAIFITKYKLLMHSVPAFLGSIYLNSQPRVFKSQGRLKHPLRNKTHTSKGISFNLCKQKSRIFNIPSLGILVCLEGERAYLTLLGHWRMCVKSIDTFHLNFPSAIIVSMLLQHRRKRSNFNIQWHSHCYRLIQYLTKQNLREYDVQIILWDVLINGNYI
jgi:hypothetical protein